jgi:hypothetical protein
MKTVVKKVVIEGMDFALVREPEWGTDHQYGTVPYSEVDENGRLKRALLNGFEMCVAATPEEAIERREDVLLAQKWKAKHPNATEVEEMNAIADIVRRRVTGA